MQADDDQANDRQDHRNRDEHQVVAEGHPAPRTQIEHVRAEALAGHGREGARRDVALLHPDQEHGDDAQCHAHGRAQVVVGVIADRLREDLGGQGFPAIGRRKFERHAELTSTGHEHDDRTRQNARHNQWQGNGHGRAHKARTSRPRAVFQ